LSSNDARIKHHSHAVSWRTRGEGGHKKKSGRAGHALAESHAVVHLHLPFTLGASGRHAGGRDPWGLRPPSRAVGSLQPTDFQEADTRHNVQHGVPRESRVESRVPRVRRDEEEGQEGQVGQQTETPPCWLDLSPSPACATPRRCRTAKPGGTPALDLTARYLIQRYIGGMLAFAGFCLQDHPYPPDRTHFMISCFHPRAVPSSHRCLRKDRRTIHLTATATLRE